MALDGFFKRKNAKGQVDVKPASSLFSLGQKRQGEKVPFEFALPYLFVALLGAMAADLTSLSLRSLMIPNAAPPGKRSLYQPPAYKPRPSYDNILARNIFNSDGFIPEVKTDSNQVANLEGPAKESQLPLTLVGTIVHINPGKSVATIAMKSAADKVLPYIPNDDIEGLATLMRVERKKAYIRNLSSGAYEFIQIKDENGGLSFQKKATVTVDGPITKEGDNNFSISRNDLKAQMANLPQLLTQARAIPNPVPGQPGKINGFRIVDIQENSLYTKLGVKNGDIIEGVNGEPLDSPAKAMELYNSLNNQSQVRLQVDRNGTTSTMTYNIQ